MNNLFCKKLPYLLIFFGLIYSIINSVNDTTKHDHYRFSVNNNEIHSIIRTDVAQYWEYAHSFKTDFEKKKDFFRSGDEVVNSYLYPRFIAFYFILINEEIKEQNNKFKLQNYKWGIPFLQTVIFYLLLILLFKKIKKFFSYKASIMIIGFLALEPTIIQFHSSYWTESLYFSFLILIFYFLIDLKKFFFLNFFLGLLIGLSFLQRSVSLYLIFPIIIYITIIFKKKSTLPITGCILGYFIVIMFFGYYNFLRSGNFYIVNWDQKDAPYYLLAHKLNEETNEHKYLKREEWIKNNNIDLDNETDRRKLSEYQYKYFLKSLDGKVLYLIYLHGWKSLQSLILDPFNINNEYYIDKEIKHYWESFRHQQNIRIFYSFFIYFFCLIGLLSMIKESGFKRNLSIMIILISLFYIAVLGWVGTPRYLVPNLLFMSLFFGEGLNNFLYYIRNIRSNLKKIS